MRVAFARGAPELHPGARWHREGTPVCLAAHLFAAIPLLAWVGFDGHGLDAVAWIRLYPRAWWQCGVAHIRARRIARMVVRAHGAAGVMIAVRFG